MRHCPAEFVFDMLKVIIKWLEVSYRECNRQFETPQTNNLISSRDLVKRASDLYDHLQGELLCLKKNLRGGSDGPM